MRAVPAFLFLLVTLYACNKDAAHQLNCESCPLRGTYVGQFHSTSGCYGCIPYLDTMYYGSFTVDTLGTDSIRIIRNYDGQLWTLQYNDTGTYERVWCCTGIESFTFKQPDSLLFFHNNGGSGGYFRQTFAGVRQ